MVSAGPHTRLSIDEAVRRSLHTVYDGRLERVLESLEEMGPRYCFRLNSIDCVQSETVESMRSHGLDVTPHVTVPDAAHIPVVKATPTQEETVVEADRFAAEAVMQGAHLYAPGVRKCQGLRAGMRASVSDKSGTLVGSGVARQGETMILKYHRGVAVETQCSKFRVPPLRETRWYEEGLIHLQSLPAMVTCQALDPKPDEVIVDLNCSPAGKMSYLCQLTNNEARVVGFDRNDRKVEKAREHLERLRCRNYQLIAHDSRYAHLDYTFKVDKVLVDPPCTGLGVVPKLSVDTTMTEVRNLADYQKQFLRAAAGLVKKGGVVVYSVCTITVDECEEAVRFAEDELDLVETAANPRVGSGGLRSDGLSQRFDPELDGAGYFIAKFVKS